MLGLGDADRSDPRRRHREECSDEAIQGRSTVRVALDRHAAKWRLAMTGR
jgi:hypothetical protein